MSIPFDAMKYEKEQLESDMDRFHELLQKYKDDIDDVIEFAVLYNRLIYRKRTSEY